MDKMEIIALLQKIGMKFYVDYYTFLTNENNSTDYLIELVLKDHKDYSEKAIRTRISKSRKIFSNGKGKDALLIIKNADKIDDETKNKINKLL